MDAIAAIHVVGVIVGDYAGRAEGLNPTPGGASMFVEADWMSLSVFSLMLVAAFALYIYWLVRAARSRFWVVVYLAVMALFSLAAMTGIAERNPRLFAPILMVLLIGSGMIFAFSRSAGHLIEQTSMLWLIGLQGLRLPLELILHQWANLGTVPQTMTWTGSNFDILSGFVALVSLPFLQRMPRLAWVPQLIGSVLLLNVLRVVVLSSPLPFAWPLDRPLQLMFHFPYVLIAPGFVLPALVLHILAFRKLVAGQN